MNQTRTWYLKLIAGLLTLVIILVGIAVYKVDEFTKALEKDLCATTIHRMTSSPNGSYVLVTYNVDCGATTPFNTQLSILPNNAEFSLEKYPSFFSIKNKHDLHLNWVENKKIEIDIPRGEQIYRQSSNVDGITIVYK